MRLSLYHRKNSMYDALPKDPCFLGNKISNQPDTPIYKQVERPKAWFQKDLLTGLVGGIGYLNLANKNGFGLGFEDVDYKTVPKIIDRSSPAMWF